MSLRDRLRELEDWEPFLLRESGLPGPRANLELVQAVADAGSLEQFSRWLEIDAQRAPSNTPGEFLPVCGAVGLGRLIAEGRHELLAELRPHASDSRWRVREGVGMGLQRLGRLDMPTLLELLDPWTRGTCLEQRAVVGALCEPVLVRRSEHARAVLGVLDTITGSLLERPREVSEGCTVLRQALGYGWSVAIAGLPDEGKPLLERWSRVDDRDARWIVRENLKKDRLRRMDPIWVAGLTSALRELPRGS